MEGSSGRPAPARNAGNARRGGPARAAACGVSTAAGVKQLISLQIYGEARSRGSAQGSSAWLEPRAVMGWRKRARRSQVAVKCLISLKTTGERVYNCSLVQLFASCLAVGLVAPVRPARPAGRHARGAKPREIKRLSARGKRKWHKNAGLGPGTPSVRHRPLIFFLEF
jgi:hypothetical protein